MSSFLESKFAFARLSQVAAMERRTKDPLYGAHKWWARRSPAVFRAILLAAASDEDFTEREFWSLFASTEPHLNGFMVLDPFSGGGTTGIEARRLGADFLGIDIDPLAVEIQKHALDPPGSEELRTAAAHLLDFLTEELMHLFASKNAEWTPLHYFYLYEVACLQCHWQGLLHRNLVLARDIGRRGSVTRDSRVVAFCPNCLELHYLTDDSRKTITCCGRRRRLTDGNFRAGRFRCPSCDATASHKDLRTGGRPRRLIAVEETSKTLRRRIRSPHRGDARRENQATQYLQGARDLEIPSSPLVGESAGGRPQSFGLTTPRDLFTDRQLAVFGRAFHWVRASGLEHRLERALALAVSNALTTNNKLCGYATDYGRLAPLFSVRGYSLPILSVELNALHPTAGRGTIPRNLERVVRSSRNTARRYVWDSSMKRCKPTLLNFPPHTANLSAHCASATTDLSSTPPIDMCITDPPYYDYIAYSELSEFYRHWLRLGALPGESLFPDAEGGVERFGIALGTAFRNATKRMKPGAPLVFTYHSARADAWDAVGIALDEAKLNVTALWPVWSDGDMGHHTSLGNCQWDVILVCRRVEDCDPATLSATLRKWRIKVSPLLIRDADQTSMNLALEMARQRFGRCR